MGIRYIGVIALFASACNGGASPTAPTPPPTVTIPPTIQAITVTLAGLMIVGTSEQGTATATMSNGSVQSVSGAWSSDNTSVAAVDAFGSVTPNANGRTVIRLTSGTIQGVREIRVAPNYQGRWMGQLQIVGCSQTGFFVRDNTCGNTYQNGRLLAVTLTLTQAARDIVSGTYTRAPTQSGTFTVPIEADGAITFTAPIVSPPPSGIALSGSWRVNSLTNGVMVGGMTEHWLNVGEFAGTGEMRIASELRNMSPVP